MALAVSWAMAGTVFTVRSIELFIAISMCTLAIQKLQDLESFSNMFLGYDLLATNMKFEKLAGWYTSCTRAVLILIQRSKRS